MPAPESDRDSDMRDGIREHIVWDVRVFRAAVAARLDESQWRDHDCRWAIFTDSLLLHARSLYHFFAGTKQRPGDIVAGDVVTGRDGEPWTASSLDHLKSCIDDISKFRGHLTAERSKRDRKWSATTVEAMRDEIDAAWEEFVEMIPADERDLWRI